MEFTETEIYQKAFHRYLRRGTPIELSIKTLLADKAAMDVGSKANANRLYVWVTEGDDKVRPSHGANEGRIFSFDDPPETGNPGDAYNCRCIAVPYDQASPYPDKINSVYP